MERAAALAPAIFKILRRVVLDMIHPLSYGLTTHRVVDLLLLKKRRLPTAWFSRPEVEIPYIFVLLSTVGPVKE
jgi:hypothetical protein